MHHNFFIIDAGSVRVSWMDHQASSEALCCLRAISGLPKCSACEGARMKLVRHLLARWLEHEEVSTSSQSPNIYMVYRTDVGLLPTGDSAFCYTSYAIKIVCS